MNFGPQVAKTGPDFLLTLRKFCIRLQCQASHMEVSKPHFAK